MAGFPIIIRTKAVNRIILWKIPDKVVKIPVQQETNQLIIGRITCNLKQHTVWL